VIVLLNGPLGSGKSTLAEALTESIDSCVMLDGDHLIAANPPAADEREHLHATIVLLVEHHRRLGYRHFVVDHLWTAPEELDDLRRRLAPLDDDVRSFLLTLPEDENLRRIERRAAARALDELAFERRTVSEERQALAAQPAGALGEPFDASAAPAELVRALRRRLGLS
jgi:hypothetical protein